MSPVRDCPKCGLTNPPTAQRCDCGWDFVSRSQEQSYISGDRGIKVLTGVGLPIAILIGIVRVVYWVFSETR